MNNETPKILIYGYGNPGRQDDGLGVMLANEIEEWARENSLSAIHFDTNYQLNIEDAAGISEYDLVVFADASGADVTDFLFEELKPTAAVEFTMHAVAPGFILHLCRQVFEKQPEAYLIHIKGYEWEFMANVTAGAKKNLGSAVTYLKDFIKEKLKN